MNKTTKVLSMAVAMFALVGMIGGIGSQVFADPAPDGTKKVYQFNMIAKPNSFEGNCGNGDRIFIDTDDRSSRLQITENGEWDVLDCNATSDQTAKLGIDGAGDYILYAIAHGKPGTGIDVCADYISEYDGDGDLCEVGTFSIKRDGGKSQMKLVPSELFDISLEDVIWDIDSTGAPKIQFRVYQVLN
jgi:hypothetical protein